MSGSTMSPDKDSNQKDTPDYHDVEVRKSFDIPKNTSVIEKNAPEHTVSTPGGKRSGSRASHHTARFAESTQSADNMPFVLAEGLLRSQMPLRPMSVSSKSASVSSGVPLGPSTPQYRQIPSPSEGNTATSIPLRQPRRPSSIKSIQSHVNSANVMPEYPGQQFPDVPVPRTGASEGFTSINPFYTPAPSITVPRSRYLPTIERPKTSPLTTFAPPLAAEVFGSMPTSNADMPPLLKLSFWFDLLLRQIYLHILLRLPALYFSRVVYIFEEAKLNINEIKSMVLNDEGMDWKEPTYLMTSVGRLQAQSPRYLRLKRSWEYFIDSLMREWKTLNIVSVLLLSAILSMLQIEAAASDLLTRFSALLSLICALTSLLYGCMFIIRFSSMRKTHKAVEWAEAAQRTKTSIFWNVWVLLAMPATWLAWSIILYIICVMSFVWRTGTTTDANRATFTPEQALGPRIAITALLGLGSFYFIFILTTLRYYGDQLDENWKVRVHRWREQEFIRRRPEEYDIFTMNSRATNFHVEPFIRSPHIAPNINVDEDNSSYISTGTPSIVVAPATPLTPITELSMPYAPKFDPTKVVTLHKERCIAEEAPLFLLDYQVSLEEWKAFITDLSSLWEGYQTRPNNENITRHAGIARVVTEWNLQFFNKRAIEALLCREFTDASQSSEDAIFSVYIVHWLPLSDVYLASRFVVPEEFHKIQIFGEVPLSYELIDPPERTTLYSAGSLANANIHHAIGEVADVYAQKLLSPRVMM
ncbi:hypothetical protein BDQ12DRAFT_631934 [Crucibulum laeve]|uniref:Uncharacterized protein n=1 Tax=Crucibulum laeve TaxID=68775 RepID=A0A5C3M0H7_9AGAR|nr:hypothetical protein BDQ12DRAFT_631934 [Crucibulum laeve]